MTLLGLWKNDRSPDLRILFGDFGALHLQHLTLSQAEQFLTPVEFASYFRFAFVRNPWDSAVSAAHWRSRFPNEGIRDSGDYVSWAEEVTSRGTRRPSDAHALPQVSFLTSCGEVASIGRFENYAQDLHAILGRFIKLPDPLPHQLQRSGHQHYREYFHGNLQERVARLYAEDAARFGYAF